MPQIANQDYNVISFDLADYPGYELDEETLFSFVMYKAYKLGTLFDSVAKITQGGGDVLYLSMSFVTVSLLPNGTIEFGLTLVGQSFKVTQELKQRFDDLLRWEQNRSNV